MLADLGKSWKTTKGGYLAHAQAEVALTKTKTSKRNLPKPLCRVKEKSGGEKIRKQKVGAAVITTETPNATNINMINDTTRHIAESSPKSPGHIDRQEKIAERRAQMPRSYRATYDRAVKGKSLRAAINAQCLECVCWQIKEIRNCTDLACSLYAVRPYQRSQNGREGRFNGAESNRS